MSEDCRPRLWVFAGPNGAGKSTLVKRYKVAGRLTIINPDEIAYRLHNSHRYDAATAAKAAHIAIERRKFLLKIRQSFGIETTLTGNSTLRLMQSARLSGYKVSLIYVGLLRADQSNSRVAERVKRGGHDVSERDIMRRFDRSLKNLFSAIQLSERVYILDNSGRFCRLLLRMEGKRVKFINKNLSTWFKNSIPNILWGK